MIKNLHINRSFTRILATLAFAIFILMPGLGWGQTVTIASQDFEASPSSPTMTFTTSGSGGTLTTSSGTTSATADVPSNANYFSGGTQGYKLVGPSSGTADWKLLFSSVNTTIYSSISFSIRLASFSVGSTGNGADGTDIVSVEISPDNGTTWYTRVEVTGGANSRWSFSTGTGNATNIYAANSTSKSTYVAGNGNATTTGYSTLTISSLPSVSQLAVRVNLKNNASSEVWVIDDVKLTGTLAITPTTLAITSISPSQPTMGSGFNVTVQAQDASNNPGNVTANTTFSLSTNGNAGTIGGTVTGQINSGTNSVTVTGVTLASAGTGVTLTATRTGGDALTSGTSAAFNVLAAASQLAFIGVPTTGVINTSISTFTVEARRPDNSVDNTYTGDITISKASGAGAISGTLIKPCVAGVATFNDIKFNAADTYTISAASGALTVATSGNIAISNATPSAPTGLTFGSVTYNSFTTSFVAPGTIPTGYLVLRRTGSAVTGTPVAGSVYTQGTTNIGSGINEVMYVGTSVWTNNAQTGLTDNTAYYYAVYSYNGSGPLTVYSATSLTGNQLTSTIPAPIATAANQVGSTGFTANWDAVAGAGSYKIDIYTETTGANATDLFISEYVEGTSNNKYIEIFNGTGADVDLSGYELGIANNGSSTISYSSLTGTLTNGSVIVYKNATAALTLPSGVTATSNGACTFNGNDAVVLHKISPSSYVDIFGRIGNDPGSAWTSASNSTVNQTLVRKSSVQGGVTTNPTGTGSSAFTTLETEWTQYAIDNVSNLGSHTFIGGTTQTFEVENVTVNGTSYDAAGLDPNTTYYYRVRAVGANSTSANSDIIEVLTAPDAPVATAATTITASGFAANWDASTGATDYSLDVATDDVFTNMVLGYNNLNVSNVLTYNVTGLTGNTPYYYRVRATNTGGTSANSNVINVTTTPASSTTWTGATSNAWEVSTNWSAGVPGANTDVIIPAGLDNYPTLTVAGTCKNISLGSNATSTATLLDNGQLTVTGTASVQRYFSGNTTDWHLVSSPITAATANVFFDMYLQQFDPTPDFSVTAPTELVWYTDITSPSTQLTKMEGYGLYSTLGAANTVTFTGILNTGGQSHSLSRNDNNADYGWNLLGNPFPSSIDWDAVSIPAGMTTEVHFINATTGADLSYVKGVGGAERYIPPMQGFFVSTSSATSFSLGNAQRTHSGSGNFYKSENPYMLVLQADGQNFSDNTYIHFNDQAGFEHDGVYDAYKIITASNPELPQIFSYTPANVKLSINGMPETATVPVGFTSMQSGTFTLSASKTGDLIKVVLEDLLTGVQTDLLTKNYTFNYTQGDDEKRFKVHFSTTGIDEKETVSANIYSYQQTVYVNLADNTNGDIYIYNLAGQLVSAKESASGNVQIGLNATGVYMVKVITEKETLTQKVVIR
jgi:hypothetical protein